MSDALSFVGPHEGRELDLMSKGRKPLSMFITVGDEKVTFPEKSLDALVDRGSLFKRVSTWLEEAPSGRQVCVTRTLYALATEQWRIHAMLHLIELYEALGSWRPDLERLTGSLLGYDPDDVERYVGWVSARMAINQNGGQSSA